MNRSTFFPYLSSFAGLAAVASVSACGSLDGHTGTPGTLATVQGGLLDPSGYGVHDDVRVAVAWQNIDGSGYSVSEDLPVQPVFPSSFVVQLDGPPPAAALGMSKGFDVPLAVGVVVAYEDLNGDGMLDLVPSDAGAFIDRIVGANENLYLVYIGGPGAPQTTQGFVGTPTPGYNLVQTTFCQTQPSSGSGAGSSSSGGSGSGPMGETEAGAPEEAGVPANGGGPACSPPPPQWMPMTTPYDLTVSSDPTVNRIMCQSGNSTASTGGPPVVSRWDVGAQGTPPGGYPSATDPLLACQGSTGYLDEQCVTVQQAICGPTLTSCTAIQVDLGSASPPAGWPCP